MYDEKTVEQAIAIHLETYGVRPTAVAYAPGRVEVLGNHTDYNEGTVFSAAINMGICFCISASWWKMERSRIRWKKGSIQGW